MPQKPKAIHVSGRRWFQRSYGNTYNTVSIYVDGKLIADLPEEYGYGDYYLQRATEYLALKGYLPGLKQYRYGGFEPLTIYARRKGIIFTYDVADVARRRDL